MLSYPKAEYFRKRLQNEAWTERIEDLQDQFPEVHYMLNSFMYHKYHLPEVGGDIQVQGVDFIAKSLMKNSSKIYEEQTLNLVVLDV